jgi:D-amino-acid dehydrogenase
MSIASQSSTPGATRSLTQHDAIVRLVRKHSTSYGNAGLIQCEAVFPYTFPREFGTIVSYALNIRRDAVYHLSALPRLAPLLFRYWQNSTPERVKRSARALALLMEICVDEHDTLIAEAVPSAQSVVHHRGWLNCFRTPESFNQGMADANHLDEYGVDYVVLSAAQLRDLEPHVSERYCQLNRR